MKKAIVIGSTGMVGMQLIQQLLIDENYSEVISLGRRSTGILHTKLTEYIIDFDQPENWKQLVQGDVLFSTLGTTLKAAGSKTAQYKVDFTYQYLVAQLAAANDVKYYVLVSSAGANVKSRNFYLRMKGALEEAVKKLAFDYISILKPGQLDGNRKEKRLGEKIGLHLMYALNSVGLLKRYQPIQAHEVAKAMRLAAEKESHTSYELNELFELISSRS